MKKVYSCGDNRIFPNINPCVLLLKDEHFFNVWNYASLFNEIHCPMINQKKRNKGSGERYKKQFCLRCMVSFSNQSLHICQGFCDKCLQRVDDHLCCGFYETKLCCPICKRYFTNEFRFESHKMEKLSGEFESHCDFLATLKNCDSCTRDFELTLKCKHFGKRGMIKESSRRNDKEILVGSKYSFANSQQKKYVKCGFCSGFYL